MYHTKVNFYKFSNKYTSSVPSVGACNTATDCGSLSISDNVIDAGTKGISINDVLLKMNRERDNKKGDLGYFSCHN